MCRHLDDTLNFPQLYNLPKENNVIDRIVGMDVDRVPSFLQLRDQLKRSRATSRELINPNVRFAAHHRRSLLYDEKVPQFSMTVCATLSQFCFV
ncbi:hypothetical protein ACIPPQ_00215 [Sphingopyxis sp. LARHCG72]